MRATKPADNLSFNPNLLPKGGAVPEQTLEQLQKLESQLRERDERLSELLSGKKALDDELERLRIEVAKAKNRTRRGLTITTTRKPKRAIISSTCC
jgi:type I restriction enzyme R subunit